MLILRGTPALSPFRLERLTTTLREQLGPSGHVYAEFVHFAELERTLAPAQQAVLEQLLRYGPQAMVLRSP